MTNGSSNQKGLVLAGILVIASVGLAIALGWIIYAELPHGPKKATSAKPVEWGMTNSYRLGSRATSNYYQVIAPGQPGSYQAHAVDCPPFGWNHHPNTCVPAPFWPQQPPKWEVWVHLPLGDHALLAIPPGGFDSCLPSASSPDESWVREGEEVFSISDPGHRLCGEGTG
jgi:hypothetical protein